jgi:ATP-binding cassette subfamily B protein
MTGGRRRAVRWLVEATFQADRRRAILTLIPVSPVVFGVLSVSIRYLIDAALRGDASEVTTAGVIVGLAMFGGFSAGYLQGATTLLRLRESLSLRVDDELVQVANSIVNLDRFEQPEIADRIESLRVGKGPLTFAGSLLSQVVNVAAGLLVSAAVLGSVDPPLAVLPVAIVPVAYVYYRTQVGIDVREAAVAEDRRRALHLFDVGTGPREAKELRIFGAEATLVQRYSGTWRGIDRALLEMEIRSVVARVAAWALFCVLVGGGLALTAQRQQHGTVTAGQAFLVVTLIVGLTDTALNLSAIVHQSQQALHLAEQLDELRSEAAEPVSAFSGGTLPVPDGLVDGIRLQALTYHYRGAARPALNGVDLDLPA